MDTADDAISGALATVKDMTGRKGVPEDPEASREWMARFHQTEVLIRKGAVVPLTNDLLIGASFFRKSITEDAVAWSAQTLAAISDDPGAGYDLIRRFLEPMSRPDAVTPEHLAEAIEVMSRCFTAYRLENLQEIHAFRRAFERLVLYRFCCPYPPAAVTGHLLALDRRGETNICGASIHRETLFCLGVAARANMAPWNAVTPAELIEIGFAASTGAMHDVFTDGAEPLQPFPRQKHSITRARKDPPAAAPAEPDAFEDPPAWPDQSDAPAAPSVIVIGEITGALRERRGGLLHRLREKRLLEEKRLVGCPVPLLTVPENLQFFRTKLVESFPHAKDVIDTILLDLIGRDHVSIRPTLLVGPPGACKTSLAAAIGDMLLGTAAVDIVSCTGAPDGMLAGNHASWSTATWSLPLEAIVKAGAANPLIVLDELTRAGTGRQNGNPLDTLVSMLDPGSSWRYRDVGLQTATNISHVNWIATANDMNGLPAALLDRFRVIKFPMPRWGHLEQLAASIMTEIRTERGQDINWLPDLAPFEIEALRGHWRGGSIRPLRRLVEGVIAAREQASPVC